LLRTNKNKSQLFLLLLSGFVTVSPLARADTLELEVYRTDIADQGETNFDFAGNLARTSNQSDLNGTSVFQAVGEFSYGLTDQLEAGLKLPVSYVDGAWYGNGLLTEIKYVAPHAKEGFYWGTEIEVGFESPLDEKRQWTLEAVPILGYRANKWDIVINPGLSIASAGDQRGVVEFEPSGKLAYQFAQKSAIGVEYFSEAGPLTAILPGGQRSEIAFLALDTKVGKSAINIGFGHGVNDASPRFVAKLIVDLEFD
jgi:hypothetical protein